MFDAREQKLAAILGREGIDAFLAWSPPTLAYLRGFAEGAAERFLVYGIAANGQATFVGPALSENQVRRAGVKDVRVWADGEDPIALFKALAQEWHLSSGIIAVDDEMPSLMLLQIQKALPAALFRSGGEILGQAARQKDREELNCLRKAGSIADRAFEVVCPQIRAGMTELDLNRLLSNAMADLGGIPTFCIVGTGANGAEPHHVTDSTVLTEGDVVVIDFGCTFGGYHSDITRMVCLGPATQRQKEVYAAVYDAHMAARSAIRAGVTAGQVDAAARSVLQERGWAEYFVHRTGHGVGLRIHESPYIAPASEEVLLAGDCFSIEPGVYLPGEFGVRIENLVTATESGHESFNAEPPSSLLELG